MKRAGRRPVSFVLLFGLFTFGQQAGALAQAGAIGGVIGKKEKSVSGGEDTQPPAPARSGSKSQAATKSPENVSGCGKVVGTWRWSNGLDVVVSPDGTAAATDGGRAVLTCNSGIYAFKWQAIGNVSRLTLSADGKRMSGTGTFGSESAVRK